MANMRGSKPRDPGSNPGAPAKYKNYHKNKRLTMREPFVFIA